MAGWLSSFGAAGPTIALEDLVLLGDCYYLPYEQGVEAEALYESARKLVTSPPSLWGENLDTFRKPAVRLRDLCVYVTALRDRPLFYALSRRTWELREELELLLNYVRLKERNPGGRVPLGFPFARNLPRRAGAETSTPVTAEPRRHVRA